MVLSILFGIIMTIAHYSSEHFCLKCKPYYGEILSFSAGISITYIFIDLFPRFSAGAIQISKLLFLSILLGFVLLHLVEKYIYQHSPKSKLLKELAIEDSVTSFIYHFVIGIMIVSFLNQGLSQGILFFIPVLFYTAVSTLPVDITKFKSIKTIVALSTLLGVLFARFIYTDISPLVYFSLLGFIIGVLSFTVFRHSIPSGREGKPMFLILGVIIYSLLIFLL